MSRYDDIEYVSRLISWRLKSAADPMNGPENAKEQYNYIILVLRRWLPSIQFTERVAK